MASDDLDSDGELDELLLQFLPGLRAFVRLRTGPMIRARESSRDLVQPADALDDLSG